MKISTRLTIAFLVSALSPLVLLGLWNMWTLHVETDKSMVSSREDMNEMGERTIQLQADAIAQRVALFLSTHPELDPTDAKALRARRDLGALVGQNIGERGYTVLFDDQAITYFHPDPGVVGLDLSTLSGSLPEFWALLSLSLDGSTSDGYYDWKDPDGEIRAKYMYIVPVDGTPLRVAATTYVEEFHRPLATLEENFKQLNTKVRVQLMVSMGIVAVLALGTAILLSVSISKPIHEMLSATSQLAAGNLCVQPPVGEAGELGQLAEGFGRMTSSICSIIRQVRKMTFSVGSAAGEVVATQRQHAQSAEQQASAISGAGSAVRELAATSTQIAVTAEQMVAAASRTQVGAQEGVSAVSDAAARLERIAQENEASVARVRDLGVLTEQIEGVMDLIDDIAAQTRLIAFNASIEASAAGEAGRRFAVVASEVRHLADRVGQSTEEIRTRLEEVGRTSNELMVASEREHHEIEAGLKAGHNAATVLEGILDSARETTLAVRQISQSIYEQNQATEQLEMELEPITTGSQMIAAGSQQTVAVMEDLVARAEALEMAVRAFQLPAEADLSLPDRHTTRPETHGVDDGHRQKPALA